jgi:hypothetical protein
VFFVVFCVWVWFGLFLVVVPGLLQAAFWVVVGWFVYCVPNNWVVWLVGHVFVYFSGTYIDERDAPMPGVPCLTGLLVMANSPM